MAFFCCLKECDRDAHVEAVRVGAREVAGVLGDETDKRGEVTTTMAKPEVYLTGHSKAGALKAIYLASRVCHEVITVSSSQRVLDGIRADADRILGLRETDKRKFRLLQEFVPRELEGNSAASIAE